MEHTKKKKLLIVVNVDWFFISHRMCVAEKAFEEGWDVYVSAQDTGRSNEIINKGINFINIPFSRSGTNPLKEINTFFTFYKLYKYLKPDIIHHVTLKPVVYGSLASNLLNVGATLNAISGLGYNFTDERKSFVQKAIIFLMKIGFNQNNIATLFQNKDDEKLLINLGLINSKNKIFLIKGSGVDLNTFKHLPFLKKERLHILLPTRMLWDKGIAEVREVSNLLKDKYGNKITFVLSGLADNENKASVSESYLKEWESGDYVKWIGYQKNMVDVFEKSDIVVLPSYREGMPKALIEACAIGRPIVTSSAVGCKECVDEGVNGYKVPIKSTKELARAIEKLIISEADRIRMGNNSRKKAEKEFSQDMVANMHMSIYNYLLKNSKNN